MADQTITCNSACTVTLQVELTTPILSLTLEEGAAISSAILLVWAVAYGIRMLIRTVSDGTNQPSESES